MVGWVVDVACIGGRKNSYRILVRKSEGKNHSGDLGIGGRVILKRIWSK
jgi:hypothetical protein